MTAYYNDNDRRAAAWLRELVKAGLLPQGDVDERSICDVEATDLLGYSECHFFAGIGGWPYALRLARWPEGRSVWTGSCPCQPWSIAGKRQNGFADDRHLWPEFHRLIAQCRPATLFGEQVASSFALPWLDTISNDLEATGYAVGAASLCACGVSAPHVRQRLFWVADRDFGLARGARPCMDARNGGGVRKTSSAEDVAPVRMEHAVSDGRERRLCGGTLCGRETDAQSAGSNSATGNEWQDVHWIYCRDGFVRPVKPGLKPLANGIPGRMGRLRGYGNAIVPPLASEFVKAFLEAEKEQ